MCWDHDNDKIDYILERIMKEFECELTEAYEIYCDMSVKELREYDRVDYREMYI